MHSSLRDVTVLTMAVLASAGVALGAPASYTAVLSGPAESPPNASPGTGSAQVDIDVVAHTLRVQVNFSDLIGTTTASHVHGPTAVAGTGTAGVATMTPTFVGFPLGVSSGTYDQTFDTALASTFNGSFVTANGGTVAGAEAALAAALAGGKAYLNIHTDAFPGGEIRGFLTPEPATGLAMVLGAGMILWRRRGPGLPRRG